MLLQSLYEALFTLFIMSSYIGNGTLDILYIDVFSCTFNRNLPPEWPCVLPKQWIEMYKFVSKIQYDF